MDFQTAQSELDRYGDSISGLSHEPLGITLHMGSPFSVVGHLYGDSIIAYLVARDVLGPDLDNLPDDKNTMLHVPLPLASYGSVWCCSIGYYDRDYKESVTSWKKQFDIKHDEFIDFGSRKAKVKNNQGHFKAYNMPLVYIHSRTVTFYANGNREELQRLLANLNYIGKKRSQGYGQVRKITIAPVAKDLSVFDGHHVTRPIPLSEVSDPDIISNNEKAYCAYLPPYWHKQNMDIALIPSTHSET